MWIEIYDNPVVEISGVLSLPAWGVWIEMFVSNDNFKNLVVAPRMGSVD